MDQLVTMISAKKTKITIGGLVGSLGSFVASTLLKRLGLPVLVVVPTTAKAEGVLDDLVAINGSAPVGYMPPSHLHPFDTSALALGPLNERADAMLRFSRGERSILVTQPEAFLESCPNLDWIRDHTLTLIVGEDNPRDILIRELSTAGYHRENLVASQGQFAVRGGLIDIYPYGHEDPVRIEYDFDKIISMRSFSPTTQRSVKQLNEITFLAGLEGEGQKSRILDLLPKDSVIFWFGKEEINERIESFHKRAKTAHRDGTGRDEIDPRELFRSVDDLISNAPPKNQIIGLQISRGKQVDVDFKARFPDSFGPNVKSISDYLRGYVKRDYGITLTTGTSGEKDRLEELLFDDNLDQVRVTTPTISKGFTLDRSHQAVLTAHELYDRRKLRSKHTRFRRRAAQFDRLSLRRGDLVVHAEYGIGKYEGLQMIKVQGHPHESIRIRYADDVILYIRIEQFGLVEKYAGGENAKPTLSRVGTKDWERTKKKTRKALQDMADELVALYAKRKVAKGYAFPEDTHWQREMEASFEFEDTPGQVEATEDIKDDLIKSQPMDRLLCGDVGFGKTEVAIRAAFKVVQESMQVAVLVPTTILAQQHHDTFRERLASYPISIEALSRFKTAKEQREIVKELNDGKVDIVIGTHRLVSKDVKFHKLGLLIIDEEHRFGVRHKERLKQLKTNVDVLTMTATPIPRTMHMALLGARDTSQINTAPVDRLPIQTEVHAWSEDVIHDAILREVDRQGQVFFLHNRISSIYSIKGMLERLVPGISYGVAHGQMKERDLEKVMHDFIHGRYDVLISTMIIESGLDIPNANTLIVNRADRFGLAQLYQLRGRIGRSNRQAYAYLLTPPKLAMTNDARLRLTTLSELTDLGSGMKVAMRDLEIRGAGNLLGAQQSGHINAVGFDLYTQMLEDVVKKAKGEESDVLPVVEESEVKIDFKGSALFPLDYISDSDHRYDFYRRLSTSKDMETVNQIEEELVDRFGRLPEPSRNLIAICRLKVMGRVAGFNRITIENNLLAAELKLPSDPEESQKTLGRLVAQADPEEVEFKLSQPFELIYRFNSQESLSQAQKFLLHLTRKGILRA
ncbi:MAG: transcription-repair coupling factor [Calditrichaeota bacterium]|nr:transcription-repair coupling factor [Calditrichota bacterium]